MSTPIYISRNFVEFGPFKSEEIVDFHSRGILGELDHVRNEGQDDWVFISEWIIKTTGPAPKPTVKPKAAPAPVAAAAKKVATAPVPSKKAASKKAAK
ncbi:MAG: hypothetical protein JWO94_938 [Verrucomicrobiaceae bacterium]|nr:hypothetical protein [Verrucomicrobiaceae bacterium]